RRHAAKGAEKLYTLYRSLAVRNRLPSVFASGDYLPLVTEGPLLAFLRRHEADWVLVAAPLIRCETAFPAPVSITLPAGVPQRWTDCFTGATWRPGECVEATVSDTGRKLCWPRGLTEWPVILATAR
ncbi:MAG TPA: hypothetical protein VGM89_01910, partial [Puia sp.]